MDTTAITNATTAALDDHTDYFRMCTSERMTALQKKGDINKMNINKLINAYYEKHPDGHFFDDDTLKFFGEALSRMKILKKTVSITDSRGEEHECYVVSATRTKDWSGTCKPYTYYHYFDVETMDDITPQED